MDVSSTSVLSRNMRERGKTLPSIGEIIQNSKQIKLLQNINSVYSYVLIVI